MRNLTGNSATENGQQCEIGRATMRLKTRNNAIEHAQQCKCKYAAKRTNDCAVRDLLDDLRPWTSKPFGTTRVPI